MKKIFFLILIFGFIWVWYHIISFYSSLDNTPSLRGNLRILDRHGNILADRPRPEWYSTEYAWSLENNLVKNIIQIEDRRFYEHAWFDFIGKISTIRDIYNAWAIVRWWSTLWEQYIKNTYFPHRMRSISEKIEESIDSMILEIRFSKDEILRKYLNTVYMWNGIYGINTAIERYFDGKNPDTLTPEEIVEIITRIHSPNLWEDSAGYANRISQKLYNTEFHSEFSQMKKTESINIFPILTERIIKEIWLYCSGKENKLWDFLEDSPSPNICTESHTILNTTIDLDISKFAENTLEGIITPLEIQNVSNGSIYIQSSKTKKILVYIGNRGTSGENNAIDMIQKRRSVGSALKPFVYKMALDNGYDGESLLLDDARVYDTADTEKKFVPENYIPKAYGPIRLKEALGNSLNSATVRLSEYLWIGKIYEAYKRTGLDLDHESGYYGYGISLGSVEVSLENLVHSYQSLTDLSEPSNFLLFHILSESRNREKTFWATSILNTSIPLAVKTWTSTDFRDNWAVWYDDNFIIGVWVWNADGSSMNDISWISWAWPIFHHIVEYMIERELIQKTNSPLPQEIEKTSICLDTSCMRKEEDFRRKWKTNISRILSKIYMKSDFIHELTDMEIKKWKIR